jgi:hypothetical protein
MKPPSGHSLVHSEEELKMLVTASQEAGVLEEEEEQMLHRVFGFSDLTAGQVMVPRTEMIALPVDAPLSTIAEMVGKGGHARLPVYRKSLDDIVGVLQVADLFPLVVAGKAPADLSSTLRRQVVTVPERCRRDLLGDADEAHGGRHRDRRVRRDVRDGDVRGLMERIVGEVGPAEPTTASRHWPTARPSSTGSRSSPT